MTRTARRVGAAIAVLALGRLAAAVWAALHNIRGDYYASLPGAYVKSVNPTLWNSPDMAGAWGYHVDTYFHGPTQYLTLYPVAYFDSYAAIAGALLPVYAIALAGGFALLHGALSRLAPRHALAAPLFACLFLFFPLLQAFIQREFEVLVFVGLALALWCLVRDRWVAAGAVLGYLAWFKYVPLMFVGYLGLRRRYAAVGAFVLVSAAVLLVSDLVFGLSLFVNNNVPSHAAQVFNLWSYGFERREQGFIYGTGFCYGWIDVETTLANVRHGLCSLSYRTPWLPANVIYVALCLVVAVSYLRTHARIEQRPPLDGDTERWRRALEFSIVTTVYSCFFFNHYYYLIVLAIPFSVLLARGLDRSDRRLLVLSGVAYLLMSAFVVPTSALSRVTGADVWASYIKGAWFLWGELLLMALLLWEYRSLAATPMTVAWTPTTSSSVQDAAGHAAGIDR